MHKLLKTCLFVSIFQIDQNISIRSQTPEKEAERISVEANKLYANRNYWSALPLYERALSIRERVLGVDHPDTATLLSQLANAYCNVGNYVMAIKLGKRNLEFSEKKCGENHPNTAYSLMNLGITYYLMGNYTEALKNHGRALSICEKILGPNHEKTAFELMNLGDCYFSMDNYVKALQFQERGVAIYKKTFGMTHSDTAASLDSLSCTYRALGDYVKSLKTGEEAFNIRQKVFGSDHPITACSLMNLANIYYSMGNYSKALMLQERALAIYEKVSGQERSNTAGSLDSLANIYSKMGNYEKALMLQERALTINEKELGNGHPYTAGSLMNLANTYSSMGNYSKALLLQERALAIYEKEFGMLNAKTSLCLYNMAINFQAVGNYSSALQLCQKALSIREKTLGMNHPDTACSLRQQANIYEEMGNYKDALKLNESSLVILEKKLGLNHQDTLLVCKSIARLQFLTDSDHALIQKSLARVYLGNETCLQGVLSMDEKTRLTWQQENLSLTLIDLLDNDLRSEFIVRTKGIVLDSLIEDQISIKSLGQESLLSIELLSHRVRLGQLAFSSKKEDQEEVSRLKSRIDSILSSAAGQRDKSGGVRASATITPNAVAIYLPAGGVLIEFVQFTDPKIKGDGGRCYGALVLGRDGKSQFVRIDDAAGIDSSIRFLREAIAKGDEKALADQQKILSEKLWAPMAKNLPEGTKKLFIGADGQLNFLSFAALPAPDGSFLAEHYDIAYVGSGRDLARKVSASDSKVICLFADPVFDRQASAFSTNALSLRSGEVDAFGKIVLPPLPGTRVEEVAVEEVAKAGGWNPNVQLGEAASKSAIMDIKSPRILHLATHGFYLNTLSSNGAEGERGMMVMESADSRKPAPPPKIDPMHASGIALSGAQATLKAWSEGRVPDPKEDGILTAEEVGALNLDGTWLVTLSACETGVGEARSGEGVFGLRRAFMIAGAQNLLMTLWPVSDEVTPNIMADFYKEALATHDAAGSLAKVQRDWLVKLRKEKGLLAAVRDAGPFALVVMAKQDSTFSSPSTATPITAPQAPANSPTSTGSPALTPTPIPLVPEQPAPSPSPTPSPDASPNTTPVISEQTPLMKAA